MKLSPQMEPFRKSFQLLALITAGFGIILFDTVKYLQPEMEHFLERTYFAIPCILFVCTILTQSLSTLSKRQFLLSIMAVLWFAAVQAKHQRLEMGTDSISLFAICYLVAFPFAAVTDERIKYDGIRWLGKFYIAGSLLQVLCAVMLLQNMVPEALMSRIFWDGTRLNALKYPNVGACLFMIGIGFTLYFLLLEERKKKKILYALLAVIQFCGMSLTNSRTAITLTCMLFAGAVFRVICRSDLKQFVTGVAAALTVFVALFAFSQSLFGFHTKLQNAQQEVLTEEQVSQWTQEEILVQEQLPAPTLERSNPSAPPADEGRKQQHSAANSTQGSFREDIWTLNKRTYTWKAAIRAMIENPSLRIWGTKLVGVEISYRNPFKIAHAHNSWIQTMMETGIPGLLISLVYTVIALIHSIRILFTRRVDSCKWFLALMVLCIMVASFLEPFLFVGGLSTVFANFAFFFLIGYLVHWDSALYTEK